MDEPRRLTPSEKKIMAIELHNGGLSGLGYRAMARRIGGVSHTTVKKYIDDYYAEQNKDYGTKDKMRMEVTEWVMKIIRIHSSKLEFTASAKLVLQATQQYCKIHGLEAPIQIDVDMVHKFEVPAIEYVISNSREEVVKDIVPTLPSQDSSE